MCTTLLSRLLLDWINSRYGVTFQLSNDGGAVATDGVRRLGLHVAPMWEDDAAWDERLSVAEARLEGAGGAYLLWVPPRATVPVDEPEATYFVERVRSVTASLAPGERAEVPFPVTIKLAKLREEGGYASVVGGLSRWWTRITENVKGTFSVDSNALHRLTLDGATREELWSMIGRLSNGINVGQSGEFEIEEAWTLQRLDGGAAPNGVALVGAPPSVDPSDGVLVRRMARKRLAGASEALGALDVELRAVGLLGGYEYAEVETASGTLKAIDPSLYARTQVVAILVDGEVKPVFAPARLD